jgi:simple sugar transport system permease protein
LNEIDRQAKIKKWLEDRDSSLELLFFPAFSVVLGLAASGLLMLFLGENPLTIFGRMFSFAFRDMYNVADIFAKATPLILTGLAFAFAFRANLFNIGAQGQFYAGALGSVCVALTLPSLPAFLLLPLCLLSALLAGGVWGALAGWLKARFNSNEFLISMMSTYIAVAVVNFLLRGPLKESKGEYPQTDVIAQGAWIPQVIQGTRFHWGFAAALLAAFWAWWILWQTGVGFRIRAVGLNRDASAYAGIDQKKIFVGVFFTAGAFAGLAGFMEVNGLQHMLVQGFNPTLGAEGIGIAILGNAHPMGVVVASLLFGALKVGGNLVSQTSAVPPSIIGIMEGFVMLFVVLSYYLRDRWVTERKKRRLSLARTHEEQKSLAGDPL